MGPDHWQLSFSCGFFGRFCFIELVPLASLSCVSPLAVSAPAGLVEDSDMALNSGLTLSVPSFSGADESAVVLSSSSSKVLTSKVGGLESKMSALEASISSVLIKDKFDGIWIFTSGLDVGHLGASVAVIMNNFLAHHVSKVDEIPVTVLSLYAGASSGVCFGQVSEINFIIAKTVNTSIFVILGGDFNESRSGRSASYQFCLGLDLYNLREVEKTIDYILVGKNLFSTVAKHCIGPVSEFFDIDHSAVMVLVGLGGLLDIRLNSLHKQTNKDCWKFRIKNADLVRNLFSDPKAGGNLNTMWAILEREMCSRNRHSSKFFGLELLIAKIVSKICSGDMLEVDCLVRKWFTLDEAKACVFSDLVILDEDSVVFLKHLSLHIESFASNKDSIIRSVLDWPFCKVVLDHLVVDGDLVLEPEEIKSKVDEIMVEWTRVCTIPSLLLDYWVRQYMSLDYVRDKAFSGVMKEISMEKLLLVVGGLPDGKAAGLSGIPNELWKHGGEVALSCLLTLLNACLSADKVPVSWQKAWILSKVLSDQILFMCSKFGVLYGDNFSVLKNTSTQSPVFAVETVVEDALKKNRELWLRIKMYDKFIEFFGNIHKSRFNKIMTDFGFSDGYHVKRHEQFFGYWICFKFSSGELSSYFVAGAFIDDTIWNILDIANEFFVVNDISINNEKTVVIPINLGVRVASLSISGLPILIAKKSEAYHYLRIFLSTKGLSKPNMTKAHSDICFFANVVLRKAITDKQFLYLVSAILQPIVSYCTQFSFVSSNICCKWDVILRKWLKSKADLSRDFPSESLCYPSLYGLKSFEQVQSKGKLTALILFYNSSGVLGQLFEHRCLNLQVLKWSSLNSLQFSVKLCVSPMNNFLAGVVKIFLCNDLSLLNSLPNAFRNLGSFFVSSILGSSLHFNSVHSLMCFGVAFGDRLFDRKRHVMSWVTFRCWKRLDPRSFVPYWFRVVSDFFCGADVSLASSAGSTCISGLNVLNSKKFSVILGGLHEIWSDSFEVFMNGSLKNFGHADVAGGAAAYFPAINLSIGVKVHGLLSSTMAELQIIALSLECVLSSCTVVMHTNSQAAIDVCVSEMLLSAPDFCSSCWLKRCQIFNLIHEKNLSVWWIKVKGHSGILGNVKTNAAAGDAVFSHLSLPVSVWEQFLVAEGTSVSGNAHYFVWDLYRSVLIKAVNWSATTRVWHPDSHMLAGFTSQRSSCLCMYLMKTVHQWLPMVVRKQLYDRSYPSVLCLLCCEVELSDHVFMCSHDVKICGEVLAVASANWLFMVGPCGLLSSAVLRSLHWWSVDVELYLVLYKGFVLREWCAEAVRIFDGRKETVGAVVGFVKHLVELYCSKAWLMRSAFRVRMKKAGLVGNNSLFSGLSCCLGSLLSDKVVRMLSIAGSFAVSFGRYLSCLFFSGLDGSLCVSISV
ncbi:hypothetical protein G9A89_014516 [Geosiphon pyriformis]|nr:hypothetical protein G9A89_014516 [Geosiphon pyriformis]